MREVNDDEASVAGYKTFLRDCLNRRPSGLRQRLALALQKHKSFISQITSPAYSVPIPAGDLPTIFEVCHLSTDEQAYFLKLYEAAHADRPIQARRTLTRNVDSLRIALPQFQSAATRREVEAAIREAAANIIRVARGVENRSDEEVS